MSENKHTRGPWWSPDGKTIKQDYRPLTDVGGCIIAGVIGGSASGPFFIEDDEEVAANAWLITAAPDLLELATMVRDSFSGGRVITFSDEDIDRFNEVIAKALGDQP